MKRRRLNRNELEVRYSNGERDFRGADLCGEDFSEMDLSEIDLRGSALDRTRWIGAALRHAKFTRASLRWSDFASADLSGADFSYAILSEAHLRLATLLRANFSFARCTWAVFFSANLSLVDMTGADLRCSDLRAASFEHAIFSGASLDNALLDAPNATNDDTIASLMARRDAATHAIVEQACGLILSKHQEGASSHAAKRSARPFDDAALFNAASAFGDVLSDGAAPTPRDPSELVSPMEVKASAGAMAGGDPQTARVEPAAENKNKNIAGAEDVASAVDHLADETGEADEDAEDGVLQNAQSAAEIAQSRLSSLQRRFLQLENDYDNALNQLDEAERGRESFEKSARQMIARNERAQEIFDAEKKKLVGNYGALKQMIGFKDEKISALSAEVERLKPIEEITSEQLRSLEVGNQTLREEKHEFLVQLEDTKRQFVFAELRAEKAEAYLKEALGEAQKWQEIAEKQNREIDGLERAIAKLEASEFADNQELLGRLRRQNFAMKEHLSKANEVFAQKNEEISSLKLMLRRSGQDKTQLDLLTEEVAALKREKVSLLARLSERG